jgi:hypothetical protein
MNYLGHYVFNHEVCGLEPAPHFVMGVALPDLWPRFSRRRRIQWRCVREAALPGPHARQLRNGLLNHVAVDRRFHVLPRFVGWQRELKARVATDGMHPALLDFITHIALELTLDQHLLHQNPELADRFYDSLAACDPTAVEVSIGRLAGVNTSGLRDLLQTFVARRFLRKYKRPEALFAAMRHVLSLTSARRLPGDELLYEVLAQAAELVDPRAVWDELVSDGSSSNLPAP